MKVNGLEILGSLEVEEGEQLLPDRAAQPCMVAIIGNVGSAIWPPFERARQNRPGLTLDQWTEDVVGGIASDFGLDAVFPFQGPPYHPFIRWAKRTGNLFSSPLGLTIHPSFGLWHAFRAALLIDHTVDRPEASAEHPCETCRDRPCLSACPVGAFGGDGYDFAACLDHVATPSNPCREGGCLARIACPVGRRYRYREPHAAFHMQELLKAHGRT
ncbi:MAG: hypothetical protein OEU92_18070 [Alphaproteobacteria bacterium]|nr:hypothetical protein [Alphaproteobacteria bacterium]